MKVGQEMYKAQQGKPGAGDPSTSSGQGGGAEGKADESQGDKGDNKKDEGNTQDAEFTEKK